MTLFCLQPVWAAPADPGGFAGDPDLALAEDGGTWQLIEKGDFSAGASVGDPTNERFVVFPANAVDEVEAAGLLPSTEAQEIRDELDAEGIPYCSVNDEGKRQNLFYNDDLRDFVLDRHEHLITSCNLLDRPEVFSFDFWQEPITGGELDRHKPGSAEAWED